MPFRDLLLVIFKFVNAAKGVPAAQLSREIGCDYKVAFVLLHKLRECMESETTGAQVGGESAEVEVDGAYFGGHVRPENLKEDRVDRRLAENQNGKRQCLGVIRERGGRTLPFVVPDEAALVRVIGRKVRLGSVRPRRRAVRLRRAARPLQRQADQPQGSLQPGRRLHQRRRKLLLRIHPARTAG